MATLACTRRTMRGFFYTLLFTFSPRSYRPYSYCSNNSFLWVYRHPVLAWSCSLICFSLYARMSLKGFMKSASRSLESFASTIISLFAILTVGSKFFAGYFRLLPELEIFFPSFSVFWASFEVEGTNWQSASIFRHNSRADHHYFLMVLYSVQNFYSDFTAYLASRMRRYLFVLFR